MQAGEELCSIQDDLAFRNQCNIPQVPFSSCLVREQLHIQLQPQPGEESLVTPTGYKLECLVYVRKNVICMNGMHFEKYCQP